MSERFLDVSHEALIRGWPRLRGWLDEDRAGLRLQRRITETAQEWQRSNRDNDLLYRGARLIQAQEWRARHEMELNPLERQFLDASIALKQRLEEQEREQQQRELEAAQKLAEAEGRRAAEQMAGRRRQRLFSCGLAVLVLVTGVIAAVAVKQRSTAQRATHVALAAKKETSEAASRGNVSLARYSEQRGKNAQALAQLAQALRWNPENREASGLTAAMLTQLSCHVPLTDSMRHEGEVKSAQFSPDGQRVVTASGDGTARLWFVASGKPIGEPMKHDRQVNSAQFSPDGQRVITASGDGTARLWDAASGKPIGESMKHEGAVKSAQFSPDSQRVVTASMDKTARLWDAASMTDKGTREDILLLAELAEATAGVTLETVGQSENLKLLTPEQIRASWEKIAAKFLGPSLKLTPLQRFMKWRVSDPRSRTISPFSQATVSDWLENIIKDRTIEELRVAIQVDPTNARVTAHLGRLLADQALKQSGDPDVARRARGEADFLTNRALKLAPDSDEVKKLRDEVVKLLELKPN
jgi:Novel STAND NTPase 1/WD domain, G-beta repeat